MKVLLLALALHGGADDGSLGIGMDVLPEAFAFAASRLCFSPRLTLSTCDSLRCRWDLGAGVAMSASLTPGTLSVNRVEAELDRATAPGAAYAKACAAIVALLAPEASAAEQRSIAASIAAASGGRIRLEVPEAGYSFYGSSQAAGGARCGAAATAVDVGSKL